MTKEASLSKQGEGEWHYAAQNRPEPNGDCRKIVTLLDGGMTWVGIRAYNHERGYWMNNSEPIKEEVLAWMDLPEPASKRWIHGKLIGRER